MVTTWLMQRQKMQRVLLEEEQLAICLLSYKILKSKKKNKRRHMWWVHDIVKSRRQQGAYHNLLNEQQADGEKFQQYMRLTREQFAQVLFHVESDLLKHSRVRKVISPRERLAICLRFLATGESFRSLAFSYRVGATTVGNIVREVCQVLWDKLSPIHMKVPTTTEEWKTISDDFLQKWNFPHCLGAIDGKHVVIKAPWKSGSLYYNYKGTFSIVLMALADANLKFIAIDVGWFGRNGDAGIFANSNLGKAITKNTLQFPADTPLPQGAHLDPVPYVVVGDGAFPLQIHLMRPFPGKYCPQDQQTYNYRLSRARRIVENAFGVLSARWRVYHTKIAVQPDMTNDIVKATCVLHNMCRTNSSFAS